MIEAHAMLFDTLQYTKKAKMVGFSEAQAEFQAEVMAEVINEKLVSKHTLKHALKSQEDRLVIKFGAMLVMAIGVLTAILKL